MKNVRSVFKMQALKLGVLQTLSMLYQNQNPLSGKNNWNLSTVFWFQDQWWELKRHVVGHGLF